MRSQATRLVGAIHSSVALLLEPINHLVMEGQPPVHHITMATLMLLNNKMMYNRTIGLYELCVLVYIRMRVFAQSLNSMHPFIDSLATRSFTHPPTHSHSHTNTHTYCALTHKYTHILCIHMHTNTHTHKYTHILCTHTHTHTLTHTHAYLHSSFRSTLVEPDPLSIPLLAG